MNPLEISDILKNLCLHNLERAPLVLTRPSFPKGRKVRTPFGNCEIANVQEKPEGIQVVFWATRNQLGSYLNKEVQKINEQISRQARMGVVDENGEVLIKPLRLIP